MIEKLEAMLAQGQDSKLLRFSLGKAYLEADRPADAVEHLAHCLALDPEYSAAWNAYGKALRAADRDADALVAWRRGIGVAERNGDKQAAKEMRVFARRLEKQGRNGG
ncbi:MAG TPA: tetratricopeptide repeat protein [Gammaproteobacteria bacterium]|nr:tetratricopeptide repeat protein [Gammaproteobacteria bacterium]